MLGTWSMRAIASDHQKLVLQQRSGYAVETACVWSRYVVLLSVAITSMLFGISERYFSGIGDSFLFNLVAMSVDSKVVEWGHVTS